MTAAGITSVGQARRRRLPNRRAALTESIVVGGIAYSATIGFDELGRPREIFLHGAKHGSGMAAILDDVSVVVSVAMQHGVSAEALARSVSRIPQGDGVPALPGSI